MTDDEREGAEGAAGLLSLGMAWPPDGEIAQIAAAARPARGGGRVCPGRWTPIIRYPGWAGGQVTLTFPRMTFRLEREASESAARMLGAAVRLLGAESEVAAFREALRRPIIW